MIFLGLQYGIQSMASDLMQQLKTGVMMEDLRPVLMRFDQLQLTLKVAGLDGRQFLNILERYFENIM